jgi:hypothetical protein
MRTDDDIDWEHAFDDFHPALSAQLYASQDYRIRLAPRAAQATVGAVKTWVRGAVNALRIKVLRHHTAP